jgi:RNA polymerase sigma factor (sigma-70 family)
VFEAGLEGRGSISVLETSSVPFAVRVRAKALQADRTWSDNQEVVAADGDIPGAIDQAIERAQVGDSRGFSALFEVFGAPVAGYLRSRGVPDPDGLANDVFLRAFRNIHTFRGDASRFRSWLYTIAQNAAIDDARHRRRRVAEVPLPERIDAPGGDVEHDAVAQLAQERVHALLSTLSPDQRDVLVLRIIADLTIEETGAVLGKSYEAVKALQRRGLASLRRALSHDQVVPR